MIGFDIHTENMREGDYRRFRCGDYCHIILRPVIAHRLAEAPRECRVVSGREIELRNPSDLDGDRLIRALGDLQIRCQGNNDDRPRVLYAWDVEYRDVLSVDLRKSERMTWLLRRIRQSLERAEAKGGLPLTFGQFAGRVAHACQGQFFCMKQDNRHEGYDESDYRLLPLGEGISAIDRIADEWQRAVEPAECA